MRFPHQLADLLRPLRRAEAPSLAALGSQLCTASQFDEPKYARWCAAIREQPRHHRKQWEFVWILEALHRAGMLRPGRRGLGFGCGREPIAAVLASHGCEVVATDLAAEDAAARGWIDGGQHARQLSDLNARGICPPEEFAARVSFRPVDMNAIPAALRGFDFLWSSCAFEHLGSLEHGLAYVVNALDCLAPGGVAVHTTEFNVSSNEETLESPGLSIYRRRDLQRLRQMVKRSGGELLPVNFHAGDRTLDAHHDLPPYRDSPHLKLQIDRWVVTSVGLIVRKRGARR
jgi:hypothetical protein